MTTTTINTLHHHLREIARVRRMDLGNTREYVRELALQESLRDANLAELPLTALPRFCETAWAKTLGPGCRREDFEPYLREYALAIRLRLDPILTCVEAMLAAPRIWSLQEMHEAWVVLHDLLALMDHERRAQKRLVGIDLPRIVRALHTRLENTLWEKGKMLETSARMGLFGGEEQDVLDIIMRHTTL